VADELADERRMMERALVTGVTGFVGSHVARALLATGAEVHALVRPGAHLGRVPDLVDRIVVHVDDGSVDAMAAVVATSRPEATFHLATNFISEHVASDIDELVADNVGFPTRLADALGDEGRVFVNVGTGWQHVDGARYRPKNLYAATKQAFEDVLRFYVERGRLRAVTLNLYDSYGPLDHRAKLLGALIGALRTGNVLSMSSGVQLIDLVHVDDIVRALFLAADLCAAGAPVEVGGFEEKPGVPVFSASSGRPRSLRELVDVLGKVAGRAVPVAWGARPDRAGDMVAPWDAGPPVPGWSPHVDLETGLAELLAHAGLAPA
jgi:nucleoside-diphosphate-sugar epimerase